MASTILQQYRKALADAGVVDDRDDLFVVKDFLGPLGQQNPQLFELDPELATQWGAIREADSPGTIGGIINTAKSAFDRSVQAMNVMGGVGETDAQDIADYENRIRSRPVAPAWEDWTRSTGSDAVRAFLRNPVEVTTNIIASGFAGSLPALGGGLAAGAAGSAAGPAGGIAGAAIGTGAGSLATEYGSKFLDVIREAGADLADPESILRVVSDPEVRARAQEMGLRRGLPVAAFDAASAGLAGKFLKGVRTATAAQNIRRGVGEALVQGGLGGGGEIAGAISAGEPISPGAVFEEVIGELGPGATEVAGAGIRRRLTDPTEVPPARRDISFTTPGGSEINLSGDAAAVIAAADRMNPASQQTVEAEIVPRTNAQIVTSVEAMTPEQKVARATELSAQPTRLTEEETELELLLAEIPRAAAPSVVQPAIQPAEAVADVVQIEAPPTPVIRTPVETVELISNLGPAEFVQWTRAIPEGGMTSEAHRIGIAAINNAETIAALKTALAAVDAQAKAAEATARAAPPDLRAEATDAWSAIGAKRQFFSEAIQAAENTGSAAGAPEVATAHAEISGTVPISIPSPAELSPVVPSTAEPSAAPAELAVATPSVPQPDAPTIATPGVFRDREAVQAEIEILGQELAKVVHSDGPRRQEIYNQILPLFEELGRLEARPPATPRDIAFQTQREAAQLPGEASRAQQFLGVVNRLQRQGVMVDLFAKRFFEVGVRAEIESQIMALRQRQAEATTDSERRAINREIGRRQARIGEISQARGATFSPWHISLAVDDIQNASTANMVTLLHEAAEALGMRLNPVMYGRILRAIDRSATKLRERAENAASRTGVPRATETGPMDLLAETLAQELTAEGVPDSTNLAQAIWRWIKDLYYRTAMALQAGFGVEPSDERALDWFNNQLERMVGGDYDYRLARLLDRYYVQPMDEQVRRHKRPTGTPGGVADYYDPYLRRVTQPGVLPYTSDSVDWNVQFQTIATQKTALGEEINEVEAAARIQAAVQNRYIEEAEKVRTASGSELPWAEWWSIVGVGEDPKVILAGMEGKKPGVSTAVIGGDRMTQYMNGLAAVDARALIENWQIEAQQKLAKATEAIDDQSDQVIEAARLVNKIEGDRRNAEVHEATLKDRLKAMVRRFVKDNSSGYKLAEQQGELAEAVRQQEDLLDNEAIPETYQRVFQQILDGETPIFAYMRAIAELDLPLSDLTQSEVVKAIRDNADTNTQLGLLARNRPLMVALAALARRNAGQMDEIHLGWLRDTEQYRKIHEELQEIRQASDLTLREMMRGMNDRIKGATLRDRLVRDYLKRRRELQTARNRVAAAQLRADSISTAQPALTEAVERAQQQGSEAPSDWTPSEGSVFTEMRLGDDGQWSRHRRVLHFNADGSAVDSAGIRSAIAQNNLWLQANEKKAGSQSYETIKRQTSELAMRDMEATYPAVQGLKLFRFLGLLADDAKKLGGRAAAELAQMFQAFEFVRFSHGQELQTKSQAWSQAFSRTMRAAGIKDIGVFRQQVYDPVNYFLNTNPGLDEEAAIRNAVRAARARLPDSATVADNFGEQMAELLRKTKDVSEFLIGIAQQQGSFISDPRLKSELRRAVAQGWLTNMRALDGGLVQAITNDMDKSGWRVARRTVTDRNGKARAEIVRATTFEDLTAADTVETASPALDRRLQILFTPAIIRDWLLPFINKGGVEVFKNGGDPIPQLVLQNAWAKANGNILAWIDAVGVEAGLPAAEEVEGGATTDPVADFRLSMLRQLDALYGMESKLAAESSVTRDLFDPMGPKPHVMMDARLNDTLPPEHLDFAIYDPHTAQMLLAEIGFHAKFGRNGERLQRMLDQLYSEASADKAIYERLRGTTKASRVAEAEAMGRDYRDLARAADRYGQIDAMKKRVEAIFSIGGRGSVFEEPKIGMELMNFMSGQIVDNPKTGLYDVLSAFERPFAQRSLGPASIKSSARAIGLTAKGALGSLLEALNLHILHSSDYYKTATEARGGSRNQPWAQAVADIGPGGRQNFVDRVFVRPLRFLRYVQNKGVGSPAASREFPRLAPIPGLGVNNTIGQIAGSGAAAASMMELEQIIRRGADYFASHREDLQNPSFRFAPKDLGFGALDQGVFDWWKSNSVEYGMGTIEDMVRTAIPRLAKGDQLVTRDQALRATQMTMQEFNGQTSLNTTPSFMQNNPALRRWLPLLRWPFWKMANVGKGLGTVDGKRDYAALVRGLATLAMWNLPIGLAFTFMLDRYDEDILGKKSNLPPTGATAGLPFVGPFAEAILSDRSIPDTLKAYLVRSARAGNIAGLASDIAGQFASPTDALSGRRVFSLDQRVLAMSQFLNAQQAFTNFAHQDWTATWASVWAPLMRSMGGNGALHGIDIVNNMLGLDNAESRQVMRTNANLWLRSSANELDIELRAGGSGTPTPMSAWTREMSTAAMANDRIGFLEAHRKALEAARKVVAKDPTIPAMDKEREAEKRVIAGWRARDPLSVFVRRPTDIEMRLLFSIMDDTGRQEVQSALRRYQQFSRLIVPSVDERQARTAEKRLMSQGMSNPFRRELSGAIR